MKKIRIASLLFPPLGLVLLWRSDQASLGRRILGTIGIGLYSVLYTGAMVALLVRFTGLELEWRGGFPPVFTWHKTHPNYDAVEASRRSQPKLPPPAQAILAQVDWPGFRGPHRDGHYAGTPIATNWPADGL